jgi:hypothetical protein
VIQLGGKPEFPVLDSRTHLVYQNLHVRVDKLATWASTAGDIDQIRRGVIQDGVSILRYVP